MTLRGMRAGSFRSMLAAWPRSGAGVQQACAVAA